MVSHYAHLLTYSSKNGKMTQYGKREIITDNCPHSQQQIHIGIHRQDLVTGHHCMVIAARLTFH